MRRRTTCFTLLAVAAIAGCQGGTEMAEKTPSSTKVAPAPIERAGAPAGEIETFRASYEKAKKEFKKNPAAKTTYVQATVAYATAVMYGDGPPKKKYPQALNLYEDALKLDPNNQEAKGNRDMILSIYRQMDRTPPKRK